jgi:hypothetical protein
LKNLELLMKTRFFRFAAFFCSFFLMLSFLLISPSPVWAYQAASGEGGGGSLNSGAEPSEPKAGGSFNEHVNSAAMNGINGGLAGGLAVGAAAGGPVGVAKGFVTGAVANIAKGCLSGCHESNNEPKNTQSNGNSKQNPYN